MPPTTAAASAIQYLRPALEVGANRIQPCGPGTSQGPALCAEVGRVFCERESEGCLADFHSELTPGREVADARGQAVLDPLHQRLPCLFPSLYTVVQKWNEASPKVFRKR